MASICGRALAKPSRQKNLGSEAQDMADRITARMTQAAKKLKVKLKI